MEMRYSAARKKGIAPKPSPYNKIIRKTSEAMINT
jgi:hypothetical protein